MCILFFVTNGNPRIDGYKLILASNRDEYYARPALPAAPWDENPFVYGGRDMEPGREGGTWMAISAKGKVFKFGALLNITGEARHASALGRGFLVADYVSDNKTNEEYTNQVVNGGKQYDSYNLVTIELRDKMAKVIHCSNVHEEQREWPEGKVLGFGNSPPHISLEKVKGGQKKFEDIVLQDQSKEDLVDSLMGLLKDRERHWPDAELYKRAPNWGELLSSVCVQMPEAGYGSRTRSVVIVDADNNVDFYEETMLTSDPYGEWKKTHLQAKF